MKRFGAVFAGIILLAGGMFAWWKSGFAGLNEFSPAAMPHLASGLGAWGILGLGFILGLKHALDTDHLVAVSTIVSERKGFFSSSLIGAMWGLGHTASLFVVGLIVIAIGLKIPDKVAQGMEFCVAAMLVGLGVNVLLKLSEGGTLHAHPHEHGGKRHIHPHVHEHAPANAHVHSSGVTGHHPSRSISNFLKNITGKRSILIGMVHGMAGSAALMLIVLATIPSPALAIAYIAIFGIGSIGGMLIMSTLISIPFVFTANTSDRMNHLVRLLSGLVSVVFGLFYAYQIGIVDGLFR